MPRSSAKDDRVVRPAGFLRGLKEISLFFQGRDEVHKTMRRVARKLEKAKIPYVVVGGMAVYAQGYRRTTDDVDFLLTRQGFLDFRRLFVPADFEPQPRRPKRFVDRANGVGFDILITGLFPGSGQPGPVAYPDPSTVGQQVLDKIRVVDLTNLVQLKLAARRHQDFADVVNLIRSNDLDESFQERLHPSLRRDFIECLDEMRREEEYEARQDEQMEKQLRKGEYGAEDD
jgi:hypothetical protein